MVPFYIVDVFAQARYEGNPLAVFDCRATLLSDVEMQSIAREINFQETTFVLGGTLDEGFRVRIFTPEYEVPFAGHPTLGTAWVLAHRLAHSGSNALTLRLNVGDIRVEWEGTTAWLQATQPQFGRKFDVAEVAALLHLPVAAMDEAQPIRLISTGLPYVLIPLSSLDAIRRLRLVADECEAWLHKNRLHKLNSSDKLTAAFYPFCDETYQRGHDLNARMLCLENVKIVEDFATGSAASCLLAYLLHERNAGRCFAGSETLRRKIEQGYEVGRPSVIELAGKRLTEQTYELRVGGQVHYVAAGEWGS